MPTVSFLKAVANPARRQVLAWLRDPRAHFPPQVDGDLVVDGVCAVFLADKLGISAPALSAHMRLLSAAGLVVATRKRGWVFYRRDDDALRRAVAELGATL